MRKNYLIGILFAAIVAIAAGDYLFNRSSGAQEAPKSDAKDQKKGDLFDLLMKELDKKKDTPPAFPPLQGPDNPLEKVDPKKETPPPLLPTPTSEPKDLIPPPISFPTPKTDEKPKKDPPLEFPPLDPKPVSEPKPIIPPVKVDDKQPVSPVTQKDDKKEPLFPPLDNPKEKPVIIPPKDVIVPPKDVSLPPKQSNDPPTVVVPQPKQGIAEEIAKLKDCPWKLHVELIDGRTVITATVNKKCSVRIVCQSLDLQTEKALLRATGKVQINCDEGNATCDLLTIPLMEDRMVLEGSATLSTGMMKAIGDKLSLQMQSERGVNAISLSPNDDTGIRQAVAMVPATKDKQWSSYGKLRTVDSNTWQLENGGRVIAYVVPREGGTLDRFVGQTISVLGIRERNQDGLPVLRVTHIALP